MNKEIVIRTTVGFVGILFGISYVKKSISNKLWKGSALILTKAVQSYSDENQELKKEIEELKRDQVVVKDELES